MTAKPKLTFEERVIRAQALWRGEFYRCPVTNRVLDSAEPADDKVLCNCLSAQRVGGTHYKIGLKRATAADYVRQHDGERR